MFTSNENSIIFKAFDVGVDVVKSTKKNKKSHQRNMRIRTSKRCQAFVLIFKFQKFIAILFLFYVAFKCQSMANNNEMQIENIKQRGNKLRSQHSM